MIRNLALRLIGIFGALALLGILILLSPIVVMGLLLDLAGPGPQLTY